MKKRALPPYKGASNNAAFFDTGMPFCPPDALSNILVYDLVKDRPRMGSRPGTSQYFYGSFGGGSWVQGCGVVSRGRTPTGYTLGDGTNLTNTDGDDHVQQAVTGNIWRADSAWGLTAYEYENVSAGGTPPVQDTGPTQIPVQVIATSPDQTKIIVGETYVDASTDTVGRVTCRNAETLAVIWSKKLDDAGIDRFVTAIACNSEFVFVATNHFIRMYKLSDGADAPGVANNSVHGFNGWSSVAKDVKVDAAGTTLYGLFLGSALGATLPSGVVVTAGIYAQHFRSGVMKFTINTLAQIAASGNVLKPITQTTFSPQLATTGEDYYEGNGTTKHNYLRFSEQMPWAPRGMSPVAMALRPSGGFVVIHANAAWGPNGTIGDDHYFAPTGERWNITAFTSAGVYDWRQDGDSIFTEDGGAGFYNDLLDTTAKAIAIDADGNVFTAGRRTKIVADADGTSVFMWSPQGQYLADKDLGGTVNALAVMPSSQLIVAGTDRNDDYPDATGVFAQLFQLSNGDLTQRRVFPDLGGTVAVHGVTGIGFNGPVAQGEDRDSLAWVSDWR